MTSATIEAPTEQAASLAEMAMSDYRAAIVSVAKGEPIPRKALLELLVLAGRSAAQYEADCDTIRKRMVAAEQLDQAAGMETEVVAAQQAADAALEDLRRIRAECDQRIADADDQVRRLRAAHAGLVEKRAKLESLAREYLTRTADPAIDARAGAIRARTNGLSKSQVVLRGHRFGRTAANEIDQTRRTAAEEIDQTLAAKLTPDRFALAD